MTILAVVPTLGMRPEWLLATTSSIREQADVQVRLVVVGPDGTPGQAACTEAGLDYVPFEGGLSAAINFGFERAGDAEYCLWLGDDDLLAPGSLARTTRALEAVPRGSYAYGQIRYIDADGETLWYARPTRLAAPYLAYGKNLVPQPGSVFRSSALRAVGGVREDLRNSMDQDLFVRLRGVGPAVYVAHELASYRVHATTITSTKGVGDEGEQLRREHAHGRAYGLLRPMTRKLDRLWWGLQRRMPAPPSPRVAGGRPYHRQRCDGG